MLMVAFVVKVIPRNSSFIENSRFNTSCFSLNFQSRKFAYIGERRNTASLQGAVSLERRTFVILINLQSFLFYKDFGFQEKENVKRNCVKGFCVEDQKT